MMYKILLSIFLAVFLIGCDHDDTSTTTGTGSSGDTVVTGNGTTIVNGDIGEPNPDDVADTTDVVCPILPIGTTLGDETISTVEIQTMLNDAGVCSDGVGGEYDFE